MLPETAKQGWEGHPINTYETEELLDLSLWDKLHS